MFYGKIELESMSGENVIINDVMITFKSKGFLWKKYYLEIKPINSYGRCCGEIINRTKD